MRKFIQIIEGNAHPGIPDAIEEKYSHGDCMWMALALNNRFGWPIAAQMERDPVHGDYVAHAYCIMPDGRECDILGPQTKVDIWTSDYQMWTPQALLSTMTKDKAEIRRKMAEAHADMVRYVYPLLPQMMVKAANDQL